MQIYIIVRWGNDASIDGANGEDTIYIIRAPNMAEAIEIAECELINQPHKRCEPIANVCIELGQDVQPGLEPGVIVGPYFNFFHTSDALRSWVRHYSDGEWEKVR